MPITLDPPLAYDVDVLVAGGGPAGVAAALSAARAGARVLLVERMGFLGGSATAMQVPAFAPFSDRTRAIVRGIGWEVLTNLLARMDRPIPDPDRYDVPQDGGARMDWVPIDVEALKRLYDDLCEAAGVEVLLHTGLVKTASRPSPPFPLPHAVVHVLHGHPGEGESSEKDGPHPPAPSPASLGEGESGKAWTNTPAQGDYLGSNLSDYARPLLLSSPDSPSPTAWGRGKGGEGRETVLTTLLLANKSGLTLARARVFIDATGDADLAALAGCPFDQGDADGRTQGMTLCFTVAGGNRTAYLHYVYSTGDGYLAKLIALARAAGDYDLPDASLVGLSFKSETIAGANMGHVYECDPTDAAAVSRAEREGRRVVAKLIPFLRKYVPGQENVTLISTGPHIGVRESRRIAGDYRLTLEDYLACRTFPDDIARCAYFIDRHAVTSAAAAHAKSISNVSNGSEARSYALPPGRSHGIPYRCLLPQGVENLIVAGRCLSADRAVQGATRVMPYCFATGEAAGLAAAMAASGSGRLRDVDTTELRTRLLAQGAWLGE